MMHYSVQPRDRIFVKDYGILSFAKDMGKNIGKNISKNKNRIKNFFLIMLNKLQDMRLKLFQKEQFKKQREELVI